MESPFKGETGLRRLINAFGYSADGLEAAFQHEDAFRQEVFLACVLIPLGLYWGKTNIEKVMLAGAIILVLIVELLNSSIEATVDHTSVECHPLAKRAKDIGSSAVFLTLINFFLVWGLVLFS